MEKKIQDAKLMNLIIFMTDFVRQVIEGGNAFTQSHFFILLVQMSAEDLQNNASPFIRILAQETTPKIEKQAFCTFVDGLLDEN